jgi:hypothetical protein
VRCGSGTAWAGGVLGAGVLDCTVSGNWVVVFTGTLDSGVLENTDRLSAERSAGAPGVVIARLEDCEGLIGCTYW